MTVKRFIEKYKNNPDIIDRFYELAGKYAETNRISADLRAMEEVKRLIDKKR